MASTHALVQALVLGALLFLNVPAATARSLETGGAADQTKEVQEDAFQPLLSITSENKVQEEEVAVSAANSGFVANGETYNYCTFFCLDDVEIQFYSEATGYKGRLALEFTNGAGGSKCSEDGVWCVELRDFAGAIAKVEAQFKYGGRTSPWVTLRGRAICSAQPGGSTGPTIKTCEATFKDTFFNF